MPDKCEELALEHLLARLSIHQDLDGEDAAIAQYERHINENTHFPKLVAKLQEITKEEQHHAKELIELMNSEEFSLASVLDEYCACRGKERGHK